MQSPNFLSGASDAACKSKSSRERSLEMVKCLKKNPKYGLASAEHAVITVSGKKTLTRILIKSPFCRRFSEKLQTWFQSSVTAHLVASLMAATDLHFVAPNRRAQKCSFKNSFQRGVMTGENLSPAVLAGF